MEEDDSGADYFFRTEYLRNAIISELRDLRLLTKGFKHREMSYVKENGRTLKFTPAFKRKYGGPDNNDSLVEYLIKLRKVFRENLTQEWPIEEKSQSKKPIKNKKKFS